MVRTKVITEDPEIIEQRIDEDSEFTVGDGDEKAELIAVKFKTREGETVTFHRGVDLFDGEGSRVGTITEIQYSLTAMQTETHSTDWYRTVMIDYESSTEGGVPLGELAEQWDEGLLTTVPEALAEKGSRKMMLWELAADSRSLCGVETVASEEGVDDRPVALRVEAFESALANSPGEFDPGANPNWIQIEEQYGWLADLYLETQ